MLGKYNWPLNIKFMNLNKTKHRKAIILKGFLYYLIIRILLLNLLINKLGDFIIKIWVKVSMITIGYLLEYKWIHILSLIEKNPKLYWKGLFENTHIGNKRIRIKINVNGYISQCKFCEIFTNNINE